MIAAREETENEMKDCDRYPHIEPHYQARAEEHQRREERRLRALDSTWEAYQERWTEQNLPFEPVEPKPAAVERMQLELDFWKCA
jgi:hypothetical protein